MMSEHLLEIQSPEVVKSEEEGNWLDLLVMLASHKALVIGTPVVTGLVALAASFLITPTFTSTARIMPPQQQQSSGIAAMLGQIGGLAGAAGGLAGIKSPSDLYVGLLESRSIADELIARYKLSERYRESTLDDTRKKLAEASHFTNGKKDGLIVISVDDRDPKFAAELANAYVEQLTKLTQTLALTEASQRRAFFEKQLKEAKDQLATAEIAMRRLQERTGMLQPNAQVGVIMSTVAQLKGTIAAKEVQLSSLRTFATGQNPERQRVEEELRSLNGQLAKLERGKTEGAGEFMVPTGKIPEVAVDYVRGMRDVKYYETIFELLAKQFELAKIDEAKDSSVIQVLDKAVPAEKKSKPSRAGLLLAGVLGGAVLGVVLAFLRVTYLQSRSNPANSQRWRRLSAAWKNR